MKLLPKIAGATSQDALPSPSSSGGPALAVGRLVADLLETLRCLGIVAVYVVGRYGDDRPRR